MFAETLYKEPDGTVSHTKFWSNIGYLLMCLAFMGITIKMIFMYTFPTSQWIEIFIAFGAMVAIPRGFSKWVAYKAGNLPCDEGKKKAAEETKVEENEKN